MRSRFTMGLSESWIACLRPILIPPLYRLLDCPTQYEQKLLDPTRVSFVI